MKAISYLFLACFSQALSASEADATGVDNTVSVDISDDATASSTSSDGNSVAPSDVPIPSSDAGEAVPAAGDSSLDTIEVVETPEEPFDDLSASSDQMNQQNVQASDLSEDVKVESVTENAQVAEGNDAGDSKDGSVNQNDKSETKPEEKKGFFSRMWDSFFGSKK